MPTAAELERLVVRLVGDASGYTSMMDEAADIAKDGAKIVEAATNRITEAVKGDTTAQVAHNAVLEQSRQLTSSLRTPLEQHADALQVVEALKKAGTISTQTYKRAIADLKTELQDATGETRELNAAESKGKAITQSLLTPLERYSQSVAEVTQLQKDGNISSKTLSRAMAQLQQEYDDAVGVTKREADAQRLLNAEMERAAAITRSNLTPLEQYQQAMAAATALNEKGHLSTKALAREQARLKEELRRLTGVTKAEADAERERDAILQRGKQITLAARSAADKLGDEIHEMNELLRQGAISANVHTASIKKLKAGYKETNGFIKRMNTNLRQASSLMSTAGNSMQSMGRNMSLYVTAPIVAFGGLSVKAFSDFDSAMTESQSIMNVNADQTQRMRDLAVELGTDSIQGPTKLAESYFFLASAGLDAEQSMGSLSTVMNFSTAGAFEMSRATDLLTDAQSALGLTVKDSGKNMQNMTRISDVLVKANTLANASVDQFSTALTSKAAAAMKAYNIELEEGTALLAAYADQGVKAELAGNATDRVLRLLGKAARDNKEAFKELKFEVFDSTGKFRNLADIIQNLETVTQGMAAEQKGATLEMLGFEARVQQVILPLLGASDAMREYEEQLRSAAGITEEVAEKQMKSFGNQMLVMWNQIKGVAIGIGELLAPAIVYLNGLLAGAIRWWNSLSKETRVVLITLAGLTAAIGPMLIVFGVLVSTVAAVVAGIAGLVTAGGAAIGVALAIVAAVGLWIAQLVAVGAALAGVVYWIVGSEGIATAWESATTSLVNFAQKAIGFFANFSTNMGALFGWLKSNWATIFVDMHGIVLQFGVNWIKNMLTATKTIFRLMNAWKGFMAGIFEEVFTFDFLKFVWKGIEQVGAAFVSFAKNAAKAIKSIFSGEGEAVTIDDFVNQMSEDFEGGKADFLGTARDILRDGLGEMKGPLDDFKATTTEMPQFVYDMGREMAEATKQGLEDGTPGAAEAAKNMSVAVKAALDNTKAEQEEPGAGEKLISKFKDAANTIGLTSRELEIYRAALKGAGPDEIAEAQRLDKKLTAMKKHNKLIDEAKRITEANLTPLEKFSQEQANLTKHLNDGLITAETYERAIKKAKKALEDAEQEVKVKVTITGIDALEAGTVATLAELDKFRSLRDVELPGVDKDAQAKKELKVPEDRVAVREPVKPLQPKEDTKHQANLETLLNEIRMNTKPSSQPILVAGPAGLRK